FQKDTLSSNANAPTFAELFEINDLKAQAQAKDTVILNLKEKLNSLNGDVKDRDTYKQLYDSIKSSRVRSKEQCDELIKKVNLKSAEVFDLNARLQEKVLVITALKEQLDKIKGKAVINEAVSLNPIDPKLLKVDVTPVVLKLRKNRTAHIDYIRHTQGEADTLRKIVESKRLLSSLNTSLDYAYKIKGKVVITEAVSLNSIDPKLLKVNVTPVVLKLRKNRAVHLDYIRYTQGEAATLGQIVESERLLSPLNTSLDHACRPNCPLMEILLEPTSNKLMVDGGEGTWFQLSYKFITTCSYPTSKYKDIIFQDFRYSDESKSSQINKDLKAQLQDKNIAISELKKLIEKEKGKSMDTKFDRPSVVRQPNAQRIPKPSVLGKPAPFSNSLDRIYFPKTMSVSKANVSEGLSKPVTTQTLPQTVKKAVSNTNVLKPEMYRTDNRTSHTRAPQLPQAVRNTNPRVSTSIGVNHTTNVSRP
nr:hypothetical protein [Tanacetum cinerariifolium]